MGELLVVHLNQMKLLDVQSQKHVIIVDLKIIDTKDSSRLLVCT
jgi:hypothetical protein